MGNSLKSIGNGTGLGLRRAGFSSTSATIYVTDPGDSFCHAWAIITHLQNRKLDWMLSNAFQLYHFMVLRCPAHQIT